MKAYVPTLVLFVLVVAWGAFADPASSQNGNGSRGIEAADVDPLTTPAVKAIDVREFESLRAAITAIGSTETDLYIASPQSVSTAVTVPANIRLVFPRGGRLVKSGAGSVLFDIGSKLEAGLYEIFDGFDRGITFNPGSVPEVYPEWWGAKADFTPSKWTDNHAAFKAALDSFAPGTTSGTVESQRGGRINLSNGDYFLSRTWEISKGVMIVGRGCGTHMPSSPTRLIFPENTTGIRVLSPFDGPDSSSYVSGAYSVIRDLALQGGGLRGKKGHGIHASSTVYLERINIHNFAEDGISIVASARGKTGNANGWSVTDCHAVTNGRHGLYVSGADANAGLATKMDCVSNGQWQIYDDSLLGNTYVQCHTHSASRKSYKCTRGAVFVGCYAEGGQSTDLAPGTLVLGGIMDWYPTIVIEGDGNGAKGTVVSTGANGEITEILMTNCGSGYTKAIVSVYPPTGSGAVLAPVITGGRITSVKIDNGGTGYVARTRAAEIMGGGPNGGFKTSRVHVANRSSGSTRAADVILGDRANTLLSLVVQGDSSPSELAPFVWNEDARSYESQYSGSPKYVGIRYVSDFSTTETGGRKAPLPPGSVEFPQGFWLGGGANARQQSVAAAAPDSGEHAQGDIVWNLAPSAGGHVGWVCTVGGTPGTWKGFGAIER